MMRFFRLLHALFPVSSLTKKGWKRGNRVCLLCSLQEQGSMETVGILVLGGRAFPCRLAETPV